MVLMMVLSCVSCRTRSGIAGDRRPTIPDQVRDDRVQMTGSNSLPVEPGFLAAAEQLQSALFADGVGSDEDPVLPGRQAPEDACLHGLLAGKAQRCFHPRQRI